MSDQLKEHIPCFAEILVEIQRPAITASAVHNECPTIVPNATMYKFCIGRKTSQRWDKCAHTIPTHTCAAASMKVAT
jgi:hypothetical protein